MRIRFHNHTGKPDCEVLPLFELAAAQFPTVTGTIDVHFRQTKLMKSFTYTIGKGVESGKEGTYRKLYWGRTNCRTWIKVLVDFDGKFPYTIKQLPYFHQHKIAIKPYTMNDWCECVFHVAAHEFAHCTQPGKKSVFGVINHRRKSRREVYCEDRATDALEVYRKPESQEWLSIRRGKLADAAHLAWCAEKAKDTSSAKLEHKRRLTVKWERKAKLAKTKISKLKVAIKRYEKQIDAQHGLAANAGK